MSITVCFHYKQIPTVMSLQPTSTVKKSAKIKFSADKIYYNFFSGVSKDYRCVKSPNMR